MQLHNIGQVVKAQLESSEHLKVSLQSSIDQVVQLATLARHPGQHPRPIHKSEETPWSIQARCHDRELKLG